MKTQIGFVLLVVLSSAAAEKKAYAPLPDKVIAARTIMLVNESGTARFGDNKSSLGTVGRS